jgi:hypothetical protein
MNSHQREQNPDVNSYRPDIEPGEDPTIPNNPTDRSSDVERNREDDVIPVPPDAGPTHPNEEPPSRDDAPVGDVDDSPKRIV